MTGAQRTFVGAVAAAVAGAVGLLAAWRYVAPFVLAVFLAAVIDPPVTALGKKLRVGRGPAVLLVLFLVLVVLGGLLVAAAYNLSAELEQLLEALPRYAVDGRAFLDGWMERLERWTGRPSSGPGLPMQPDRWAAPLRAAATGALAAFGALPQGLFVVFIGGFATYFISKDRHRLWRDVLQAVPPEWRSHVLRFRDEAVGGALAIVRVQLALAAATTGASVLALVALGVPYAWVLGLLAGLLDLAPFLGPSVVFLPLAGAYLGRGHSGPALALLAVWMLIVLGRQLLEPHLFGARLGLHPVTTLLAVYVGVRAVGVAGFVAGPVFLVVLKALFVVTLGRGGPPR